MLRRDICNLLYVGLFLCSTTQFKWIRSTVAMNTSTSGRCSACKAAPCLVTMTNGAENTCELSDFERKLCMKECSGKNCTLSSDSKYRCVERSCDICEDSPCRATDDPRNGAIKLCSLEAIDRGKCLERCHGRNCVESAEYGFICEGDPIVCERCVEKPCMLVMNYTIGRYQMCKLTAKHRDACLNKCQQGNCVVGMDEIRRYSYRCEVCEICGPSERCLMKEDRRECTISLCTITDKEKYLCLGCLHKNDHCVVFNETLDCQNADTNPPGRYCGVCKFGVCRNCRCHCLSGYAGEFCDRRCDKLCKNGGTCVYKDGMMLCTCVVGFHGPSCDQSCKACQKMCRVIVHENNVTSMCMLDEAERRDCFNECNGGHCVTRVDHHLRKLFTCIETGDCLPCGGHHCLFVKDRKDIKSCRDTHNEVKKCDSSCQRCLKVADAYGKFTYSCLQDESCVPCNNSRCLIRTNAVKCSRRKCEIDDINRFACDSVCPDRHCVLSTDHRVPYCVGKLPAEHYCARLQPCVHGVCRNCECRCHVGFIGKYCKQTCDRVCHNGGTCVERNVCACTPKYCPHDDCKSERLNTACGSLQKCQSTCRKGKCSCTNNLICACICNSGFAGPDCGVPCECVNGSCVRTAHGYQCQCYINPNYKISGKICDVVTYTGVAGLIEGVVAGSIAFAIIAVTVVTYILWRKRNVWVLKLIHRFRFYDDDEKLFDAFVSYSGGDAGTKDHQFVYNILRPTLEDALPFRLCIHHRDFSPGELIVNNIVWGIEESRRTIMLISNQYVGSAWCAEEYQKAQSEMLQLRHKVIPIFLEDPKRVEIQDPTLSHILSSVTYFQWPGIEDKVKLKKFWQRLVYSLPKKKTFDINEAIFSSIRGESITNARVNREIQDGAEYVSSGYSSGISCVNESRSTLGSLDRTNGSLDRTNGSLDRTNGDGINSGGHTENDAMAERVMTNARCGQLVENKVDMLLGDGNTKDKVRLMDAQFDGGLGSDIITRDTEGTCNESFDPETIPHDEHVRSHFVTMDTEDAYEQKTMHTVCVLDPDPSGCQLAQDVNNGKPDLNATKLNDNVDVYGSDARSFFDSATLERQLAQNVYLKRMIRRTVVDVNKVESNVLKSDKDRNDSLKSSGIQSADECKNPSDSVILEKDKVLESVTLEQHTNFTGHIDYFDSQDTFQYQSNMELNLTATIRSADDGGIKGGKSLISSEIGRVSIDGGCNHQLDLEMSLYNEGRGWNDTEMTNFGENSEVMGDMDLGELSCNRGEAILGFDSEIFVSRF